MQKSWRKFSACVCVFAVFLSGLSAKKKKADEASLQNSSNSYSADSSQSVKLSLPERKNHSYFSNVETEILSCVENGSPENLLTAITYLRKRKDSMTESERVLHFIAVSIMQVCWKSNKFIEETYAADIKNDYTGAVISSRNGFYDPPAKFTDFLSYVLPSLVLAASNTRNDYYESSLEALQEALKIRPSSVLVNYLTGLLYERTGDYKKANEFFSAASNLAPGCFECEYAFARSYFELSDSTAAFSISEKLLQTYPQNIELLKLCAESAFETGDSENAELYVSRVLQIEPENSYYLLFRARILVSKGEYIRATSLLDAYARKDSDSADYLLLRYEIQRKWNKNLSAAKATIEKAILLYPDNFSIVIKAAEFASETGELIAGKTGEELANQILEINPENLSALRIKIASLVLSQKWSEAYSESKRLLKITGGSNEDLFTHVKICLSANRKDEAWRYASELYSDNPSNEDVLQVYIGVLVSTGRTNEAARLINQFLPNASTKMKSFLYYERSFLSGSESQILSDLRSSLTANPRNKDALFRLYRIYFNKKEYRKAQYYLKQVVALSSKDEYLLRLNKQLEELLGKN